MASLFPSASDGPSAEESWIEESQQATTSEPAASDPTVSDPRYEVERLAGYDILRVRAENPGPFTLSGTNTWIVGDHPAYVVDPGPALAGHVQRLVEAVDARGGLGGIALTHDHTDHAEAVALLRAERPAPLAAARGARM